MGQISERATQLHEYFELTSQKLSTAVRGYLVVALVPDRIIFTSGPAGVLPPGRSSSLL